ncbi:hypothetical protein HYW21_03195 [Candidatus Woesearchaeota archaeon]|nr:hypothetical protein [Candidatus Woesearchaeota archaeon]
MELSESPTPQESNDQHKRVYPVIPVGTLLRFYKRPEIQEAIVAAAQQREVAVRFGNAGFGKRPDILRYPNDVLELVKEGATSFHCSEELWHNPLLLQTGMNKHTIEELRVGWDLVIDIDCQILEYSAVAGHLIINALQYHGITAISCKFSGNHGFHIGVPFASFPERCLGSATKDLFPEAPRRIARYLKDMIAPHLSKELLKKDSFETIQKKTGKPKEELLNKRVFDPFTILDIDTLLLSHRHLFRSPYSFNEKSGLISVPINPKRILDFQPVMARPDVVPLSRYSFLDRTPEKLGEATQLLVQAYDHKPQITEMIERRKEKENSFTFMESQEAIPEELFPPCIQKLLQGLPDGRKRAVFILVNFLQSVGWSYEKIEQRLLAWNKCNNEPLREVVIKGQIRYHKANKKKILPPNCDNPAYYTALGVKCEDRICTRCKNPVNYAKRRMYLQEQPKKRGRKKSTVDEPKPNNDVQELE